jgi:Flp pilus assembly protein TadD
MVVEDVMAPNPQPALTQYRQLVDADPENAEAHYNLGNALIVLGKFKDAAACYEQTLLLQRHHAEACCNLGVALAEQGLLADAVTRYEQALQLRPSYPEAMFNRANALKALGQFEAAGAGYKQALRLRPDWPAAHNNLGLTYAQMGQFGDAVASYEQALRLAPNYSEAHNNLGLCLQAQGILDLALQHFDAALQLQPDFAAAHANRAQLWLLLGHYGRGWPEYEWRWKLPGVGLPPLPQARWDGSPLAGRTILLRAEQGLGDTLQFVRYAPLVQERGGLVLVECQPSLAALLERCPGIDGLAARGSPLPDFDVQIPLLSLPGIFQTTLATVPKTGPYVFADQQLVEHWRSELGTADGFKIGIAWKGNAKYPGDRQRSIPLHHFLTLAGIPGVHLFSLQKGPGREQLAELAEGRRITDLDSRLDETSGAFMDTAAVMVNLDLIVTSDTATAHLAGAMGLPVWVPLSVACDWRWLLDREDSPWYPTLRLFRQTVVDSWDDVFDRLAVAVKAQSDARIA